MASVTIANLPIGQCIVKIGSRPAVRVRTLHVKRRLVSPAHYERVMREIDEATPYTMSREEAAERYRRFREDLFRRVRYRVGDDDD